MDTKSMAWQTGLLLLMVTRGIMNTLPLLDVCSSPPRSMYVICFCFYNSVATCSSSDSNLAFLGASNCSSLGGLCVGVDYSLGWHVW